MTPEWRILAGIWCLTAPSGEVLATLEHDGEQYRGNGVPVGPNWNDAKAKCEAAVKPKGTRR